jgi:fibronectin-binding autotransporter adhesin
MTGEYTSSTANGRTYYTITGSATFSVSDPSTFEIFAIGGGGGAGYANGGGGGGVQTNTGAFVYPSQVVSMNMPPGATYVVTIGAGGSGNINNNIGAGGNTTITGPGMNITALGGASGGYSGQWCPTERGGSGGGGCPSAGLQGGSTVANPPSNAGAGAGGPPVSYAVGGPGVMLFNGNMYGAAAPNSSVKTTGRANTGEGGSNGGDGGSGVVIISV